MNRVEIIQNLLQLFRYLKKNSRYFALLDININTKNKIFNREKFLKKISLSQLFNSHGLFKNDSKKNEIY